MQIAAGRTVNEVEVDEFLTGQRRSQPGFIEPSFPTIAGWRILAVCPFSLRGYVCAQGPVATNEKIPNSAGVNMRHINRFIK